MQLLPKPRLSVVVPCYNEELVIEEFVSRTVAACKSVVGESFEIVLVDDGSQDRTFDVARALAAVSNLIVVRLARNFGHQIAASTGLAMARGECVMLIDADLQDPPELLGEMLAILESDADVVFGRRIVRAGETWFKRLTAGVFYRLLNTLSSVPIPHDTGDFRLMRRHVVDMLNQMPEQQRFLRGMVSWIGGKQVAFAYARDPRFSGSTKYSLAKMVAFAADAISGFSTRPLRFAIYVALCSGGLGLALLAYSVIRWLTDGTIMGWTSLIVSLSFFSSLQFLLLGIVGEYVGRVFIEVKGRPLFVVDQICDGRGSFRPPSDFATLGIGERQRIIGDFLEIGSVFGVERVQDLVR